MRASSFSERALLSTVGRNYDVSPDGERVLVIRLGNVSDESTPAALILVQEELKRLVPPGGAR